MVIKWIIHKMGVWTAFCMDITIDLQTKGFWATLWDKPDKEKDFVISEPKKK